MSNYAHVIGKKPVVSLVGRRGKRQESELLGTVRDTGAILSRLHWGKKRFNRQFPHLKTML